MRTDADYNGRKVQTHAQPDWSAILERPATASGPVFIPGLAGARVLVTGAGGFIASGLIPSLAASGAESILLLDHSEQHLFEIHAALAALGFSERTVPILGSVCDRPLLESLFRDYSPSLVVHAAALKHVPLMERNPLAALATNAVGTWLVAQIAEAHRAQAMILVSTDKAVAPHSIMGAAKRIAELVMLAPSTMRRAALRLVNVIGSPCSVAPLFAGQIARGGPVTVTHPAARRYFLTPHEVTALLAEAIAAPASGILIPDPGEPLRIADLARRMIDASSRRISIVFTEPRPGDKLDESLLSAAERRAGPATPGLDRVVSPAAPDLNHHMDRLQAALGARDGVRDCARALAIVQQLVPDYQPSPLLRAFLPEAAAARP